MKPYKSNLKSTAGILRSNMTEAEQNLWQHVRCKQIHGVQFNRQKPVLNYIVDFYCARARLIIEVDGGQHFETNHQQKDKARDKALSGSGLLVLRFNNHQVLTEIDAVVDEIYHQVKARIHID